MAGGGKKVRHEPLPIEDSDKASRDKEVASATAESKQLSSGQSLKELQAQLDVEANAQEFKRDQNFKNQFDWALVVLFWAGVVAVLAIGAVWVAHHILAEAYHWLSATQLSALKSLVSGGLLASLVAAQIKKRLK
jgi:hypothetical protein